MKKAMFRYKMSLAGYSDVEIEGIERWLAGTCYSPMSRDEERAAVYEYAIICRDIDKMPMFLRLVDELARTVNLSNEYAAELVSCIIAGWCK